MASCKVKKAKANWTTAFRKILVDICLEQTLKGNKRGTCFTKEGWKNIVEAFHTMSGMSYDKKQLKNHWGVTKRQRNVWLKLIGTGSMRWDSNTQTFGASEEDWADYIKDNHEAAQFRLRGLPFTDELDSIFNGTVASEGKEPSARRRKLSDGSTSSLFHIEGPVDASPEIRTNCGTNHLNQNDAVESRGFVTSQSSLGKPNYTIGECIECLDGMEEIEQGSELYFFALDIFLKKEYREVFLQLKKSSVKAAWLRRMQSAGTPLPLH